MTLGSMACSEIGGIILQKGSDIPKREGGTGNLEGQEEGILLQYTFGIHKFLRLQIPSNHSIMLRVFLTH